jgi:transcription-repair coupling factor (superfamily II helicase)
LAFSKKSAASSFISDLSDLKVGDYVVHIEHGIGRFQGVVREVFGKGQDVGMLSFIAKEAKRFYPHPRAMMAPIGSIVVPSQW